MSENRLETVAGMEAVKFLTYYWKKASLFLNPFFNLCNLLSPTIATLLLGQNCPTLYQEVPSLCALGVNIQVLIDWSVGNMLLKHVKVQDFIVEWDNIGA